MLTRKDDKDMKNDIWLIIATCEELQLDRNTDTDKIAKTVITMLGKRDLANYFGIDRNEVLPRLTQYIFNHEY